MKKQGGVRPYIGYGMMLLGIFLPMLSFTLLSYNEWRQPQTYQRFLTEVKDLSDKQQLEQEVASYNQQIDQTTSGIVDPFTSRDYKGDYQLKHWDRDAVFAYMKIEKISLDRPIRLGATEEHLALSPSHVDGTNLPLAGKGTRSVIAGHRGWYTDTMFLYLNQLEAGDDIYLETVLGEKAHYRVFSTELITPSEWEKLLPVKDKEILTLLTCDPAMSYASHRILVHAERILEPAEVSLPSSERPAQAPTPTKKRSSVDYYNSIMYVITVTLWFSFAWVLIRLINRFRQEKREKAD